MYLTLQGKHFFFTVKVDPFSEGKQPVWIELPSLNVYKDPNGIKFFSFRVDIFFQKIS